MIALLQGHLKRVRCRVPGLNKTVTVSRLTAIAIYRSCQLQQSSLSDT